jgi:Transposase IS66 family
LFAIEREINGIAQQERLRVRSEQSRPLVLALDIWLREQRAKLSGQSKVAKAITYSLTRWPALTRFLEDGRLCMSNNAAEREIRPITLGRHNWTFAGSDHGGHRAAAIYTLVQTAKLNPSTRRPGSLTPSIGYRIIRPSASTSSCPELEVRTPAKSRCVATPAKINHALSIITSRSSPDAYIFWPDLAVGVGAKIWWVSVLGP